MLAIEVSFLTGHYHATPWGRHVNEGVPEWPPSPWRFLRALYATWKLRAPHLGADEVAGLLQDLAQPPLYKLPPSTTAHTRHYMPGRAPDKPMLVFDTFKVVRPGDAVVLVWPRVELSPSRQKVLDTLLERLPYLGRAESWVTARRSSVDDRGVNCFPLEEQTPYDVSDGAQVAEVLVPALPLDIDQLAVESLTLRRQRQLVPPGSRWIRYRLPPERRSPDLADRRVTQASSRCVPSVARYALDARALPPVTETLAVGDAARRAAMSWYGRLTGNGRSPTLSGKDENGHPLTGHQHAFYLATDEDGDGRIDHLTVWAKAGFTPREIEALAAIPQLKWGHSDAGRVALALLGFGDPDVLSQSARQLFGPSTTWHSVTPFVLSRHTKVRKVPGEPGERVHVVDGPIDQLLRELEHHERPRAVKVTEFEAYPYGGGMSWYQFRRWRMTGPVPVGGAFGFEIVLPKVERGPIALGYGCHYGLGLFFAGPKP